MVYYNVAMFDLFQLLPLWYQFSLVFVLGAIIGSFLDVFTLRFHTGRSIKGRSHCLSCGKTLRWYELFPVISYLRQRGRCANCGSQIPIRLLLIEITTGLLFVLVYEYSTTLIALGLHFTLGSLLLVITLYDQRHMIIPDRLTLLVGLLAVAITLYKLPTYGLWPFLYPYLFSAMAAFSFFAFLWVVSKGRWIGFGDAKLAAPLGLLLGPLATFSFIVFSFWIGAAISLVLLSLQKLQSRGQLPLPIHLLPITMKSEVPFAPFMIAAFILVYLGGADVLGLMSFWFYGN